MGLIKGIKKFFGITTTADRLEKADKREQEAYQQAKNVGKYDHDAADKAKQDWFDSDKESTSTTAAKEAGNAAVAGGKKAVVATGGLGRLGGRAVNYFRGR